MISLTFTFEAEKDAADFFARLGTKNVEQAPVAKSQPPVAKSQAQPPVAKSPAQPPVAKSPAQPPVAKSPAQPPVAKSPAPVAKSPAPVAKSPQQIRDEIIHTLSDNLSLDLPSLARALNVSPVALGTPLATLVAEGHVVAVRNKYSLAQRTEEIVDENPMGFPDDSDD